jgi:hypothetical protein
MVFDSIKHKSWLVAYGSIIPSLNCFKIYIISDNICFSLETATIKGDMKANLPSIWVDPSILHFFLKNSLFAQCLYVL